MSRKLRYSERKRLAEHGNLGDLLEEVPKTLRVAVATALSKVPSGRTNQFRTELTLALIEHLGRAADLNGFVMTTSTDEFLDLIEIARDQGAKTVNTGTRSVRQYAGLEDRLNALMERHRFGYRLDGGQIVKVGSPALDVEVTGPTLLSVQRPGWEEVDKAFRKALEHQRGGEVDDALTAANAAVESALKAIGLAGASLGPLMKSFRISTGVPSYLKDVPELLDALIGKLMAARSTHGDAHGKHPGADPAEQALADLAIYWAGAFIAYLAETQAG